MKILHVIPSLTRERGGPTAVVQALVRHQAAAGHAVTVLTTDQGARHGEHSVELDPAAEVLQVAVWGPDRVAYAPRFRDAARACLRDCDVAHLHSIFTYPIHAALRAAVRAEVPAVLRPCGLLHRYSLGRSRWQKSAYLTLWGRRVRRACAAWHYTSEQESAESWPWDTSPRFVLPNGIDPEAFAVDRPQARRSVWQAHPALDGSPYVLFLGRLHPKKRVDLLVQAFLDSAPPEFKLVVAGPDQCGLWDPLAARHLASSAAAGRVVRVGMVAGPAKVALLAGASLFALPSEHENFGVAALEALAAGTPVLLSPQVDLAPAVLAVGLGHTAPLQVDAWREQLTRVLPGNESMDEQSDRARQWVREHYSWNRIGAELLQRYDEVRSGKASAVGVVSDPTERRGQCSTSPR